MQADAVPPRSVTARECLFAINTSPSGACVKRIAMIYRAWATDGDQEIVQLRGIVDGSLFELGAGWVSKLRHQRTKGGFFNVTRGISPEDVRLASTLV